MSHACSLPVTGHTCAWASCSSWLVLWVCPVCLSICLSAPFVRPFVCPSIYPFVCPWDLSRLSACRMATTRFQRTPAAVVYAHSTPDVAAAVKCAYNNGVRVSE